jgi:hypothetical protein
MRFVSNFAITLRGKKKEKARLAMMNDPKSGYHTLNNINIIEYGQARIESFGFDHLHPFEKKLYSMVQRGDFFGEACIMKQ